MPRVTMDSTNLVRTLELDEHYTLQSPAESGVSTANGFREGFVDAGSLVCFNANVHPQQKYDVLESTLVAQLAANKEYNRFTDSSNWYKCYNKVMAEVGWLTQGFESFEKYISFPEVFKISDVVIEIFGRELGDGEERIRTVKDTIDRLAQSDEGLTLFDSNSTSDKNGNFQILSCTADKSNQVSVAFLGSHLKSNEIKHNYIFAKMKKNDVNLFKSNQVFTLNEDVYSKVRKEVKKKLGKRAKDFIRNLKIPI